MNAAARSIGATGLLWALVGGMQIASAAEPYSVFDDAVFRPASYRDSLGEIFSTDGEPSFHVSVGAVFLQRSRPTSGTIAAGPMGVGTVIDAGSFDFGWDAGPEFIISHKSENGLIWEGRYFNDRSADATDHVENITSFRLGGIGVTILGGGDLDSIYKTQLDSSELNVHLPINDGSTFLAGFRWVELHDYLRVNIATPATFAAWDENNHLYGAQLGLNHQFLSPGSPLQFNGSVKGGVYGNVMDSQFTSTVIAGSDHDSATDAAFVGEVSFNAMYYFNDHVSIRGGYMLLWLENVALAGETATTTTQVPGGTSSPINMDGLWYHGATVALEVMW